MIHGDEMKIDARIGSLIHTMLNWSIGAMATSLGGLMPIFRSAYSAGSCTKSQRLLQKKRLARNAIPTPASIRRIRLRSSSRCSRNDMRNMPSSSSPSSLGGGGGGILPPPPEDFAGSGGAAGGDNVSAPAPPCVSEYWETLYP